jgi:hypothetical protein
MLSGRLNSPRGSSSGSAEDPPPRERRARRARVRGRPVPMETRALCLHARPIQLMSGDALSSRLVVFCDQDHRRTTGRDLHSVSHYGLAAW